MNFILLGSTDVGEKLPFPFEHGSFVGETLPGVNYYFSSKQVLKGGIFSEEMKPLRRTHQFRVTSVILRIVKPFHDYWRCGISQKWKAEAEP